MLSPQDIDQFIEQGFVHLPGAFPRELAESARNILWRDLRADPGVPSTWTQPVIRLGEYGGPPFRELVNTPALHQAFDQLVGPGCWAPRFSLGTFPVRFPVDQDPGDTGWHIDASFAPDSASAANDFLSWRVNVASRGRALLMLFLFSDVGENDAPTRIRIGSHVDVARLLAPHGEAGLSVMQVGAGWDVATAQRPETRAVGQAGDVYLCHPFLVHAAQRHRGTTPRFMAQPPLLLVRPFTLDRPEGDCAPVERAILRALRYPAEQ